MEKTELPARPGWVRDGARAGLIVLAGTLLGVVLNALSAKPVPLLAPDGPGALPERAPRLSVEAFRAELGAPQPPVVLDVRSAEAFAAGHAPGALHIPIQDLVEQLTLGEALPVLQSARRVVVFCDSEHCVAGDRAAQVLAAFKLPDVKVLQGGWEAYEAAGLAVEKGGAGRGPQPEAPR